MIENRADRKGMSRALFFATQLRFHRASNRQVRISRALVSPTRSLNSLNTLPSMPFTGKSASKVVLHIAARKQGQRSQ